MQLHAYLFHCNNHESVKLAFIVIIDYQYVPVLFSANFIKCDIYYGVESYQTN